MSEVVRDYESRVVDSEGNTYTARAMGNAMADRPWFGWLEFQSLAEPLRVLRTDRETTQPSRDALQYWASGIEPIYLAGAFTRAR